MSKRNKEEKVVCLYFNVYVSRLLLIAGFSFLLMLAFANTKAEPRTQRDNQRGYPHSELPGNGWEEPRRCRWPSHERLTRYSKPPGALLLASRTAPGPLAAPEVCTLWPAGQIQLTAVYKSSLFGTKPRASFPFCLWLFHAPVATLSSYSSDGVACKAENVYHLARCRKCFPTPVSSPTCSPNWRKEGRTRRPPHILPSGTSPVLWLVSKCAVDLLVCLLQSTPMYPEETSQWYITFL